MKSKKNYKFFCERWGGVRGVLVLFGRKIQIAEKYPKKIKGFEGIPKISEGKMLNFIGKVRYGKEGEGGFEVFDGGLMIIILFGLYWC